MSEDNDSASGRQVISRAAALRALAEDNSGQSLGQIAKKTDLPRTTVHRIVAALEAQQLAATTPAGVRLGQALVRLAASAHTDGSPPRAPSSRRWGGGCAKPWTCVPGPARGIGRPVRLGPGTARGRGGGHRLSDPLHRAWQGPAGAPGRRGAGGAAGRAAGTPHRQHHHRAQGSAGAAGRGPDPGWALDLEEHAVGICGIGVHIETGQSEQYALSVALPAARYEGQLDAAWRPCSSARPRLNPCWPADRAAALGRRRRDGRSWEGLKCNEIFNFSLHQAVIQAQPRRRSGARAVHPASRRRISPCPALERLGAAFV